MTFDSLINLLILLAGGVAYALRSEYRMTRLEEGLDSIREEIGGRLRRGEKRRRGPLP